MIVLVELPTLLISVKQHQRRRFWLLCLKSNREVLDLLLASSILGIVIRLQRVAFNRAQAIVQGMVTSSIL